MEKYHEIWLESHPHVDKAWLMRALDMGMQIHHIDFNHDNNDPENLMLVEGADHMLIHNKKIRFTTKTQVLDMRLTRGEMAYSLRQKGITWNNVAQEMGYKRGSQALSVARVYAEYHNKQWPAQYNNPNKKEREKRCKEAYAKRSQGLPWKKVGEELDVPFRYAIAAAQEHARKRSLPWPIVLEDAENG